MNFLKSTLGSFFDIIHNFISAGISNPNISYGLAIILFTAIIRVFLLPLTIKQIKSQAIMQKLQPEMKKLQDKYKNDPQRAQQEISKLYKEHNANPLSGCLPLLIQMPILFAMFYIFNNLTAIEGVSFLWVKDLSKPDTLYILPVLSAATTYLSGVMMSMGGSKDNPQAKQTSTMNTAMAVMFGFFSLRFKSALILYFVTNNLFQMAQSYVMKTLANKKEIMEA